MNVKLLRKIAKHILEEPKRLFMWDFLIRQDAIPDSRVKAFPSCGTVGCIAGWACQLSGKKKIKTPRGFLRAGLELLDLTPAEGRLLFQPAYWPERFEGGINDDGKAKTAKIAAARIEHFIKTKGKE